MATAARSGEHRPISRSEWRTIALLGLPTLGLALSVTTVTAYLPKVASEFIGSSAVIGLLVGAEGFVALVLPVTVGSWSDSVRTRVGGRLPFVLAGVPPMALTLIAMGFVSTPAEVAVVVLVFYLAYFTAYAPYRALYPDLVPEEIEGRAQSTQALWRGAGTCLALVAGGLLLAIGQPVPFAAAAVVLVGTVGAFTVVSARRREAERRPGAGPGVRARLGELRSLVADHPALRSFLMANALWELTLGAIKAFVVLYITVGLGRSLSATGGVLGAVAAVVLVGAVAGGKLADALGRPRVMQAALWVYGIGLLVPVLTKSTWLLVAAIPPVAFGGGVLMALPYALLTPMMPEEHHGALTGFYSLSRGLGTMLGPLLAGAAVELLAGPLASTHGYAGMWAVASGAILLSIPLLRRLEAEAAVSSDPARESAGS